MGVQNDSTVSRPTMSETVSNSDILQMIRNALDRIDSSGNLQDSAYHLLTQIALNTNLPRTFTETPVVIDDTGIKASTLLIDCPSDKRICIFDLYLSLDAASDVKWEDAAGNDIMGPMFAPNNGQGFVRNYPHGLILKQGKSLYYTNGRHEELIKNLEDVVQILQKAINCINKSIFILTGAFLFISIATQLVFTLWGN
jgi:hypothetical protein